jgi:hypothetical protein
MAALTPRDLVVGRKYTYTNALGVNRTAVFKGIIKVVTQEDRQEADDFHRSSGEEREPGTTQYLLFRALGNNLVEKPLEPGEYDFFIEGELRGRYDESAIPGPFENWYTPLPGRITNIQLIREGGKRKTRGRKRRYKIKRSHKK